MVISLASMVVAAAITLLANHITGYAGVDAARQPAEAFWYDNDLPRC